MSYYHLDDLFDENWWTKCPTPSKPRPIKEDHENLSVKGYENISVGIQANNITADSVTVKEGITIQSLLAIMMKMMSWKQ